MNKEETKQAWKEFWKRVSETPTSTFIESRVELLQKLDSIMRCMNDEECYMTWILTVPDEATKEDFEDIAGDDEFFDEVLELFLRLFAWYKSTE